MKTSTVLRQWLLLSAAAILTAGLAARGNSQPEHVTLEMF